MATKKIICKEIDEYLDWCYKNPDKINKKRWKLIKNIVEATLNRDDVFFDEKTFNACIKYCEKWYYKLFPYQKFIYAFIFMYINDVPLFPILIIVMGRGNGKDGFIAPLCNFLQTPIYGVKNYHIDIVATSEEQSLGTFDVVHNMLESHKDKFKTKFRITHEKIVNKETFSILRYNTSNAATKDGKQTGMIVFNEYHAYTDTKQIDIFTGALGKVKHPRTIIITTNGDVRGGPLDDLLSSCDAVLEGENKSLGYFPFICNLDDEKEVDNPDNWIKANPSIEYLPVLKQEITRQYEEMKLRPNKKFAFMTKRMNMPARDEAQTVTSWDNIQATNKPLPDLSGMTCIGGIDYADVNDFCGCVLLFRKGDMRYLIHHSFVCSSSIHLPYLKFPLNEAIDKGLCTMLNTPTIDAKEVVNWFLEMSKKYNIKKIAMDTFRYNLLREEFENVGIYPISKENPNGTLALVRSGGITHNKIAPTIEEVFINHKIIWGDDMMMRWYTNNTGVKTDGKGNKTYFKIEWQTRKTDGFMAFVHAMSLEDELPKNNSDGAMNFDSFSF